MLSSIFTSVDFSRNFIICRFLQVTEPNRIWLGSITKRSIS